MTTRTRLIIQSGDENVARYLDASEPFHRAYAEACDAEYARFDGCWPGASHPAWNRLPMMLDAFERGYQQVLWLDSDTLVVDQLVNVFERAPFDHCGSRRLHPGDGDGPPWEHAPFCMRRTAGGFYWPMDGDDQWEGWNDGVLLVSRSQRAVDSIEWVWDKRTATPLPHHQPTLWELNWILDLVKQEPAGLCVEMDQRFNWQPFNGSSPEQYAVIKAWHGIAHQERWRDFSAAVKALSS